MELTQVIADGAMRALVLHALDKGVDSAEYLPQLRAIVKAEYSELLDTLKDAQLMGEPMLKQTVNVFCNSWAVKALKS